MLSAASRFSMITDWNFTVDGLVDCNNWPKFLLFNVFICNDSSLTETIKESHGYNKQVSKRRIVCSKSYFSVLLNGCVIMLKSRKIKERSSYKYSP